MIDIKPYCPRCSSVNLREDLVFRELTQYVCLECNEPFILDHNNHSCSIYDVATSKTWVHCMRCGITEVARDFTEGTIYRHICGQPPKMLTIKTGEAWKTLPDWEHKAALG